MSGVGISNFRFIAALSGLVSALLLSCAPARAQTQTDNQASYENLPSARLRIESNLVVLQVVVRDGLGHPVTGLKEEDFNLFDQGKPQSITQFEEEPSSEPPPNLPTPNLAGQTAALPTAAPPQSFLALYFDNLNSSDADLIQARDAADRYVTAGLQPNDRVAIFSTEKVLADFTSDPAHIHEALAQIHLSPRALIHGQDCPDLSEYQAMQLLQTTDFESDAWKAAWAEARVCPIRSFASSQDSSAPGPDHQSMVAIQMLAHRIVDRIEEQARLNLEQFRQVVNYVERMPGQRTVIFVSPGFLSQGEQLQLDRIIDSALRAQVVISALDPKGLAILTRENDLSHHAAVLADPRAIQARHNLDAAQNSVGSDVMAELAQGTGGEFFHNDNDLKAGFAALAEHPAHYILAFAPKGMKYDGKFHALKVTLAEKHKGYSIQARRGYFAVAEKAASPPQSATETNPGVEPAEKNGAAQQNPPPIAQPAASAPVADPQAVEQAQISEALSSKTDESQLPVGIDVQPAAGLGDTQGLSVLTHLEVSTLHFQKNGDRNLNAIKFVVAVFDQNDNVVLVKERDAKIDLLDNQLAVFVSNGVEVTTVFQLKPGTYRLRVVVTDSEEHRLTAFSRQVNVP